MNLTKFILACLLLGNIKWSDSSDQLRLTELRIAQLIRNAGFTSFFENHLLTRIESYESRNCSMSQSGVGTVALVSFLDPYLMPKIKC